MICSWTNTAHSRQTAPPYPIISRSQRHHVAVADKVVQRSPMFVSPTEKNQTCRGQCQAGQCEQQHTGTPSEGAQTAPDADGCTTLAVGDSYASRLQRGICTAQSSIVMYSYTVTVLLGTRLAWSAHWVPRASAMFGHEFGKERIKHTKHRIPASCLHT